MYQQRDVNQFAVKRWMFAPGEDRNYTPPEITEFCWQKRWAVRAQRRSQRVRGPRKR